VAKSKAKFFGWNPPFVGGAQNILTRQEDDRLIKNDILQLLLTVPGERVMRPTFGVRLRSFVFEQTISSDLSLLESSIKTAIEFYDSRVVVSDVIIKRDDDRNGINISIVVTMKNDPSHEISIEQFLSTR
jgi:uncharacterized protein